MKTLKAICVLLILFFSMTIYSQWQEQTSGVSSRLNCIKIFTGNVTYICGNNGTVLRSVNNGSNWIDLTGNGIPLNVDLVSIGGLSDNAVTIGGNTVSGSVIYMSSNQGQNWFQVFSQPGGRLRSLSGKIYIGDPVGGRWSIWNSSNYGLNWDSTGYYLPQNAGERGMDNSFFNDGDDYAFTFGTNNYRVYKRLYTTWSTITINSMQNISAIGWCNLQNGYVGGSDLLYTTNNGVSWVSAGLPGSGDITSIASQPGLYSTWVLRNDNMVYTKSYSGTWNNSYSSPSGNYVFSKLGSSYTNLFAVRDNGGISHRNIPPFPTGISLISELAESFKLSQNYPNPFNPVTHFEFRIADFGLVRLTVFDAIGREIEALVNQQLQPGTYEVSWDASAYPSGVYYYRLEAGSFTETKKIVLIK